MNQSFGLPDMVGEGDYQDPKDPPGSAPDICSVVLISETTCTMSTII